MMEGWKKGTLTLIRDGSGLFSTEPLCGLFWCWSRTWTRKRTDVQLQVRGQPLHQVRTDANNRWRRGWVNQSGFWVPPTWKMTVLSSRGGRSYTVLEGTQSSPWIQTRQSEPSRNDQSCIFMSFISVHITSAPPTSRLTG